MFLTSISVSTPKPSCCHLRPLDTPAQTGSNELGIDRWGRGYILANLGEVSLERGNTEEALGRIEELSGNQEEADQNFGIAINILEELEMPDRLR